MGAYLKVLNRRQEAKRVALGIPANLKDISIMSTAEATAYKIELAQIMQRGGYNMDKLNENSFDDMTDFQWVDLDITYERLADALWSSGTLCSCTFFECTDRSGRTRRGRIYFSGYGGREV